MRGMEFVPLVSDGFGPPAYYRTECETMSLGALENSGEYKPVLHLYNDIDYKYTACYVTKDSHKWGVIPVENENSFWLRQTCSKLEDCQLACKCIQWLDRFPTGLPTVSPTRSPETSNPTAVPTHSVPTVSPSLSPTLITRVELVYKSFGGDELINFKYVSVQNNIDVENEGVYTLNNYVNGNLEGDIVSEMGVPNEKDSIQFLVPADNIKSFTIELENGLDCKH